MNSPHARALRAGMEPDDREPAEVFRQQPPKSLYRYRSMAGEQRGFVKDILANSRFYWSAPADFNDPFDFAPLVEIPTGLKLQSALQKLRTRQRILVGRDRADALIRELTRLSRPQLIERVRRSLEDTARQVGVLCYSEIPTSVLMWGHYADCHRGVCLEYDPYAAPIEPSNMLYKVRYRSERPVVRRFLDREDSGELAEGLTTKAIYWEYEQEWRAIENHGANQLIPFEPKALTGIVLGNRITTENENLIRAWCAERLSPPRISRAVASAHTFGIEIVPA